MRRFLALALAPVAALLSSACSSNAGLRPQSMLACDPAALERNGRREGPAIVADVYGSVSAVPLDAVTVLDAGVYRAALTQSLYSERTPGGAVKVTARIANCTDVRLQLRARTHFLRDDQAPAEPDSAWQTLFLEPRSLTTYQESSLSSAGVASYLIELDRDR